MRDQPNVQALWGALIVEELVRQGVELFVIAPGSRSAPLVVAVARNPAARAVVWIDERGAAFHALGYARGRGKPAAVITTSGTAAANLLPAIVESSLDQVPLIALTADRPPELSDAGANQAIDQQNLFGPYLRWSFNLPCPDDRVSARMVLTTVDQAVQRATTSAVGPVQLNCPFREPLAPSELAWDRGCLAGLEAWTRGGAPFTRITSGPVAGSAADVREAARVIGEAERGLLLTGSLRSREGQSALGELAEVLGWPWVTDVRSQLRLGNGTAHHMPHLDRLFAHAPGTWHPDVVLQVGGRLTSKRLQGFLDRGLAAHHLLVDPSARRIDPGHRVTWRIQADIGSWCRALITALDDAAPRAGAGELRSVQTRLETVMEEAIGGGDTLSEAWVARWLTRHIPPEQVLFVSSSMPIRDIDDYGALDGPKLRVEANRGASGIDGVVSTAAGFARGCARPCTVLIGDIALLHDLNALGMLANLETRLTVVVLNNGGGSIFSFLPVADYSDVFTPFFDTPHTLRFDGISRSFGLNYAHATSRSGFERAYQQATVSDEHALIEVASDQATNLASHRAIEKALEAAVRTFDVR